MSIMYVLLDHEYITVFKKRNANTNFKCPQIKRIVCCTNNIRIGREINELKIHIRLK